MNVFYREQELLILSLITDSGVKLGSAHFRASDQ